MEDKKIVTNLVEDKTLIKDDLEAIKSALVSIASSIGIIENALNKFIAKKQFDQYKKEEASLEAVPVERPEITQTRSADTGGSFSDIIKSLLLNPAMIAAFSGLAYMLLPPEIKEKINKFFSSFFKELTVLNVELDAFKQALALAGIALGTFLGAKFIQSVGEALILVTALLAKARSMIGKSAKAGKKLGSAVLKNKPVIIGGAAILGTTGAYAADEYRSEERDVERSSNENAGIVGTVVGPLPTVIDKPLSTYSGPMGAPADTGVHVQRVQAPTITGDDASIMAMIRKHEGVRNVPYTDTRGFWTVGIGHLIGRDLPPEYNRRFTDQEIEDLFVRDYFKHKRAAEQIPGYNKLDEKGKAALIDLTFNMGPKWIDQWPILKRQLEEGDVEAAAINLESSDWYKQVGNRAPAVVALLRSSKTTGGSILENVASAGTLETPAATKGEAVSKFSEMTERLFSDINTVVNNTIDLSRAVSEKEGVMPPPPIPSPIADRGSLSFGIKHSSAG